MSGTAQTTRRAVFLDRDGVLNESVVRNGKPYPPETPTDLRIIPGTREALARLKERGFLLIVVTNQPDVGRGSQSESAVEEMHRYLRSELPLDDVFTCFHDDADQCDCRKPQPGMITRAARQYGIDLSQSYLVGDRWRDVDAGANAGCKTLWIDRGYQERSSSAAPDARVQSLTEGVDWILKTEENSIGNNAPGLRRLRATALFLFAALFAMYSAMGPGTRVGFGYADEEVESALRMMSIVTAVSKGRPIPPMIWSRHGPIPLLLDIPFLRLGKVLATPDFALSFEPIFFTAALLTIAFLWLRSICSPATSLFLTVAGAFGTMLWPYAYIGLETKQSFVMLLAGYLGLARGKIRGWPRVLGFALLCGLGLTIKSTGVVLWPVVAFLLYVQFREDWRQRWGQLLASSSIIVALCAVNIVFQRFYWLDTGEAAFRKLLVESSLQILTNVVGLFGSPTKGLFVVAPILIAALWAIPRAFRRNRELVVFATLILVCTMGFLSLLTYSFDETWGSRYLHVTIAPLLVCVGAAWPRIQWRVHLPLAFLASFGIVFSFLGAFFYYGTRGNVSHSAGQNTMEWLTSDVVWNEVAFNARLFRVWWHAGSEPVPWTPSHIWVWTVPPGVPEWRSVDLRRFADPQPFLFFYWNRVRDGHQESLLRFYLFCMVAGPLLLLRTAWMSLDIRKGKTAATRELKSISKTRVVLGLTIGAILALAGVWIARPVQSTPKLRLDRAEVEAGQGDYTLKVAEMPNENVVVRYSVNGVESGEMTAALDSTGSVHFDVLAETPKGVYRMLGFKKKGDLFWIPTDIAITVK